MPPEKRFETVFYNLSLKIALVLSVEGSVGLVSPPGRNAGVSVGTYCAISDTSALSADPGAPPVSVGIGGISYAIATGSSFAFFVRATTGATLSFLGLLPLDRA